MSADMTVREMIDLCPYQSLVGGIDANLKSNPPAAILAVPEPGIIEHDADDIDVVRDLIASGKTVLIMCAAHDDRERLLDLLGIKSTNRIRNGGRA